MAGNSNSGTSITFRLSEAELKKKIDSFRASRADGSHGIVTWPDFCSYLGYSEDDVAECYQRGTSSNNAYSGRAQMLKVFRTECRALTYRTGDKQQKLVEIETKKDYLKPEKEDGGRLEIHTLFGVAGDDRWVEAMQ